MPEGCGERAELGESGVCQSGKVHMQVPPSTSGDTCTCTPNTEEGGEGEGERDLATPPSTSEVTFGRVPPQVVSDEAPLSGSVTVCVSQEQASYGEREEERVDCTPSGSDVVSLPPTAMSPTVTSPLPLPLPLPVPNQSPLLSTPDQDPVVATLPPSPPSRVRGWRRGTESSKPSAGMLLYWYRALAYVRCRCH
ncbi:hypothetical protein KIPB_001158 [Kipferlia bialata]|uniref:Uncharacterized protein n=1 Tax=Kipferlia bialata TaxID=797122 RepID=A0A391NUD4_9EUKA|nr:hypothetical protein KIPB_001158 [Kipferlia bialata]|eukprot:g1158.t1